MAIAQQMAAELKQLVKVQLKDHGIWPMCRSTRARATVGWPR
jgi:hypothetical protein